MTLMMFHVESYSSEVACSSLGIKNVSHASTYRVSGLSGDLTSAQVDLKHWIYMW